MVFNVTNKKYQKIKIFLDVNETVSLEPKETKKVIISEISQHLRDLEIEGSISIKRVEK